MWQPYQILVTEWFLVAFCLILVCVRLYVQLTTRWRPWREILLVFAWAALVGDSVITQIFDKYGFLTEDDISNGTDKDLPYEQALIVGKLNFADNFTWTLGTSACRVLLLMMYNDLCPRQTFPKIWWLTAFTWVLVVGLTIALNFIYVFLLCFPGPVSDIWDPKSDCTPYEMYFLVGIIATLIGDVFVYIIPVIIICQIRNLTKIQRIGAMAMFVIGFINVGSMFVMFALEGVLMLSASSTINEELVFGIYMFVLVTQLPTSIMILCIPQLRVIGRWRCGFNRKVGSSMGSDCAQEAKGGRPLRIAVGTTPVENRGTDPMVDLEMSLPPERSISQSNISERKERELFSSEVVGLSLHNDPTDDVGWAEDTPARQQDDTDLVSVRKE